MSSRGTAFVSTELAPDSNCTFSSKVNSASFSSISFEMLVSHIGSLDILAGGVAIVVVGAYRLYRMLP